MIAIYRSSRQIIQDFTVINIALKQTYAAKENERSIAIIKTQMAPMCGAIY